MRLLQQFFEALEKLVEERDKKDGPELQLQLQAFIVPTSIILPPSIMIRMRNIY